MKLYNQNHECVECELEISKEVYHYSTEKFKVSLCRDCQDWIREKKDETTSECLSLYLELRKRKVPAELEKFDGSKTIDIAVVDAKVNIEVDGQQHNFDHQQALSDLKRTYYSFKKGYLTLRIPNSLVRKHIEETADLITDFLNISKQASVKRQKRKQWR